MRVARGALLLLGLAGLVSPALAAEPCAPGATYLIRHAEKAEGGDPDVELSETGRSNALALVAWFEGKTVDAIYATHLRRTQQTALPLAAARDLDLRVLPASDTARLVQRLRERHCGQQVVVFGHGNTLPEVAEELGVEPFLIDESEFGWVYAVRPGSPMALRSRYVPEAVEPAAPAR